MRRSILAAAAALVFLVLAGPAAAQSTTGSLAGTVRSGDGTPMPGALVAAVSADTGAVRQAIADHEGKYRIDLLAPGLWSIAARLGDGPEGTRLLVTVALQRTATVDPIIGSGVTETVTVIAPAPVVDPERVGGELSVDRLMFQDLPIAGRQITDLALLDSSVRAAPPGQFYGERGSVFVVNGQSGRSNSFLVDGLDNNDLTSNTTLNAFFSGLVIREFKVLTHQFAPEFGRAGGGVLNIITRQGTNRPSTDLFAQGVAQGASQPGSFVASLPDDGDSSDVGSRFETGLSAGGPFRRDRSFYFFAYEHQQSIEVVPFTGAGRDGVAGGFTLAPVRDDNLFLRTDFNLGQGQSLMVRLSADDRTAGGINVGGTTTPEAGFEIDERDLQLVASLTSVLGPGLLNEGRILAGSSGFDQYADSSRPGADRPSGVFGGNNLNRQVRGEDRLQLVDNLTWQTGRHTLKFGVDLIRSRTSIETRFNPNGNFLYDTDMPFEPGDCGDLNASDHDPNAPGYPYNPVYCQGDPNGIDDDGDGTVDEPGILGTYPVVYQLIDGRPEAALHDTRVGLFAQDTWQAGPEWLLIYGLRYDVGTFHLPDGTAVPSSIPNGGAGADRNNIAPRAGFTFAPAGSRWVTRGGAGIFYDKIVLGFPAVASITSGTEIGLIFPQGMALEITEDVVEQVGIDAIRAGLLFPDNLILRFSTGTRLDTPYAVLYDLGVERAVGTRGSFSANVTRTLGYHRMRMRDLNPPLPPYRPYDEPVHADTTVGSIAAFQSDGRSWYSGLDLQWRWKGERNWYSVSYTLSRAADTGPDPLKSGIYLPSESFDMEGETGRSDADRRHRLAIAGAMRLPWGGMMASGLLQAASGVPFNVTLGTDRNLDGITSDRPYGVDRNTGAATPIGIVNAERARTGLPPVTHLTEPALLQVDLRVWKPFLLRGDGRQGEIFLQVFNLLNRFNGGPVDGNLSSRNFGQAVGLAGPPLTLEAGMRLSF